jgi:periplasmic iron binding protein
MFFQPFSLLAGIAALAAASHFGRHVDQETGVAAWFEPLAVEYDFAFARVGKEGGF